MSIFEHSRWRIFNMSQHPYKHNLTEFYYTHEALPGVTNLYSALNYILAVLYPQAKDAVADVSSLPASGNTLNDQRIVLDDGDGKAAMYRWQQMEGDASASWYKVGDLDWGESTIVSQMLLKTQDWYAYKYGHDDLDSTGTAVTGVYAGQVIYGGASANTNLTLRGNSGDGTGASTGYVQTDDNFRPAVDSTYSSGTTTERWLKVWTDEITVDTMTIKTGSIVDSSGAVSFGDEDLSTTGSITGGSLVSGTLTISDGSIDDTDGTINFGDTAFTAVGAITADKITATGNTSALKAGTTIGNLTLSDGGITCATGTIDFGDENLTTTGNITGGQVNADNLRLDGNTISSTNTDGNITLSCNGNGVVDVNSAMETLGITTVGVLGVTGSITVDNLSLDGNTISSTDENGNVILDPNGSGLVEFGSAIYPTTNSEWDIGKESYVWNKLWIDGSIGGAVTEILISDLLSLRNVLYRDASRTSPAQGGDSLFYDATSGTWLASVPDTEIDHGTISGLNDDDHSQYALLVGRNGGQTLIGGTGESDNLTLTASSHGTPGSVIFTDVLRPDDDGLTDIGGSSNYIKDLYIKGQLIGARLKGYATASLPSPDASTAGWIIWDTTAEDILVDRGGQWLKMSMDKWYLQDDTTWDGATATATYTVDGSDTPARGRVSDSRLCVWQFLDNSNNFAEVDVQITRPSATQVTITAEGNLPAGTYTLIGVG